MQKNNITLIGTSQGGRISEVKRLLDSLCYYNGDNIELIFVDQSDTVELINLFNEYKALLNYKLIKSEKCSLSKARNIAISHASGNIIGFCDDDAFYNPELLMFLTQYEVLNNHIVSFPVVDMQSNGFYGNRNFPKIAINLSYLAMLQICLSVGTFIILKDKNSKQLVSFNERLGVGAEYGGSEESELFFRLKSFGFRVLFNPDYHVFHDNDPISQLENIELAKKYGSYAKGYAVVLKKYLFSSRFSLLVEIVSLSCRCILGLILKRNKMLYFYRLKGFWSGILFGWA